MKKKDKICGICNLVIDESKEFARFTHFKCNKKLLSESFYHINCFKERITGSKKNLKLQREAERVLQYAKNLCGIPEEVKL